jgi:hypothetical protein
VPQNFPGELALVNIQNESYSDKESSPNSELDRLYGDPWVELILNGTLCRFNMENNFEAWQAKKCKYFSWLIQCKFNYPTYVL